MIFMFLLFIHSFFFHFTFSQFNFLSGSTEQLSLGVYGSRGVYHPNNSPGSRSSPCMAYYDTDYDNTIIMFGGRGYSYQFNSSPRYLSDIWQYSFSQRKWRWIDGSKETDESQFIGNVNDFDEDNTPGGWRGTTCWVSQKDFLYISFGWQFEYEHTNSVWVYDMKNKMFKQIIEKRETNWGVEDEYSSDTIPPRLQNFATRGNAVKIDEDELYFFGGRCYDNDNTWLVDGDSNDLFMFSTVLGQFKFVKGSKTEDHPGFGIGLQKGKYDVTYLPHSRRDNSLWYHPNKDLYVFGGRLEPYGGGSSITVNDLWAFNKTCNSWKWLSGEISEYQSIITDYRYFNEKNMIGGIRVSGSWIYKGDLYTYGGYTSDENRMSDIWVWSVERGMWAFHYGRTGIDEIPIFDFPSMIGGRYCPGTLMVFGSTLMIFGGSEIVTQKGLNYTLFTNDMWSFKVIECNGISKSDPLVCSGNGICNVTQSDNLPKCFCGNRYNGDDCSFDTGMMILIIAISSATLLIVIISLLVVFIALCCCLKRRKKEEKKNFELIEEVEGGGKILDDVSIDNVKVDKSLFKVSFESVKLVKEIGSGGSGSVVYAAEWDSREIAFKVIRLGLKTFSDSEFDNFRDELSLILSISHPSILRCYGMCLKSPRVGMIFELCDVDLAVYIRLMNNGSREKLNFKEKCRIAFETISAINYLHNRKIIHRDLKSSNILLTKNDLSVRLADFGLSKIVHSENQKLTRRVGTSPEVSSGFKYNDKCDLYSFGIVLAELLEENVNLYGVVDFNIEVRVAIDENFRPPISPKNLEMKEYEWYIDLMKNCWQSTPESRVSAKEIIEIFKKNEAI